MAESLVFRASMKAHNGWVTAISTTPNPSPDTENMIVSASRDKTLLVWNLLRQEGNFGEPRKSLKGHSHFVQVRLSLIFFAHNLRSHAYFMKIWA